ncbi:hypothetical protein [Streptomyces sp. 11x1]|uniref:hypothetical protein n=1 Tax=Streptomyces sp. 11x1 TaxID=3038642 RepID=UPI00292CD36C|nr:hypothetical protein [Streptomyces sp. 11x1]WNZ14887.1 hypothetical protein P8T65_46475 [Streptomyces sp. 11x1]
MPSLDLPTTATAAEIITAALAERDITAEFMDEPLIGAGTNTWLDISSDQTATDVDYSRPYVSLYVYTEQTDDASVDRPIESRFDSWRVVVGDGTGRERLAFTAPAPEVDPVVEYIANWLTAPQN